MSFICFSLRCLTRFWAKWFTLFLKRGSFCEWWINHSIVCIPKALFLETSKVMKGCETHEKICSWKAARHEGREKAGTWLSIYRHMQNRDLVNLLIRWETVLANFLPVRWLSFCIHDINAFKSRSLIFHQNLCELPNFLPKFYWNFHHFNVDLGRRPQIPSHKTPLSLITLWIRLCRVLWIVCSEFGIQITKSLKQSSMMVFYLKQAFHGVWWREGKEMDEAKIVGALVN